jgi:NAD(P)-dependent dehydrogenase (short-subunit alcohol dehydrogenase family)
LDGLNALVDEIAAIAGPGRALAVETDITDLESCANCLRAAVDAFGVLHVLVNNARRLRRDPGKPEAAGHLPFWAVDPILYRETVEVNVAGTFFMSRPVTPYFIEMGYGINLTTSLRNFYPVGQSPYGVTKAAIDSSTYIWARDLEGKGVTVNALLPAAPATTPRSAAPGRERLAKGVKADFSFYPKFCPDKS